MQLYEDVVLREFLLGKLPDTTQSQIEEAVLTDDGFCEYVSAMEAELIDSYTHGELTLVDRRAFEVRYSDQSSALDIQFSRSLISFAGRQMAGRFRESRAAVKSVGIRHINPHGEHNAIPLAAFVADGPRSQSNMRPPDHDARPLVRRVREWLATWARWFR